MAITHPTGFPLAPNADTDATPAPSTYVMPHAYGAVGDLAILGIHLGTTSVVVTGITGTMTGAWSLAVRNVDSISNMSTADIWTAPVTSTSSADVLSISYSASVTGIDGDFWGDSLTGGAGTVWSIVASGHTTGAASLTFSYPALTSATTANPQAYWGAGGCANAGTGGSTSGCTYIDSPSNTGNEQVYDLSVGSNTTLTPTSNQAPAGSSHAVAVIIQAAPPAASGGLGNILPFFANPGGGPVIAPNAPLAPRGLNAAVSGTSVVLTWTNPTSGPLVAGSGIYVDGFQIANPTPAVQTYTVPSLGSGSHTFAVTAFNAGGVTQSTTATVVIVPSAGGTKPLIGWYDNSSDNPPLPPQVITTFASGSTGNAPGNQQAFTYDQTAITRFKSRFPTQQMMMCVGNCTTAQATTMAQALLANGYGNAFVRIMPEGGFSNAFDGGNIWNWVGMTAAQFIAAFGTVVRAFMAVSPNFKMVFNPEMYDFGATNSAFPGRTPMDNFPGKYDAVTNPGGCHYGSWDAYDVFSDVNQYKAIAQEYINFYQSHGLQWGICEWSILTGGGQFGDRPTFINMIASLCTAANGCAFQCIFSATGAGPGGSDSTINTGATPLSLAAYKADFG